jgi:hypothetical protein
MMTKHSSLLALTLIFFVYTACAFELTTHTAMTAAAIKQSKIGGNPNESAVIKRLGLYDREYVVGTRYIDFAQITPRAATDFENRIMEEVRRAIPSIPQPHTIPGWIIRGAIREDDNVLGTPDGTPAGDEPGGVFSRVYGHFFDPQNDRGLTVSPLSPFGARAPDWALRQSATVSNRLNHYNVPAAREAMWRALTLQAYPATASSYGPLKPSNWADTPLAKATLREAYWGTTFRALGDVLHLIQDMAQPQHTRNDAHSGVGCNNGAILSTCLGGHASYIESYLNARTLQADTFTLDEGFLPPKPGSGSVQNRTEPQLVYSGYTTPRFANYRDYFGSVNAASNKGIANYSNRGFYSFGTNRGSIAARDFPTPNDGMLSDETVDYGGGKVTLKVGPVTDYVTGTTEQNVRLSAVGFFEQFLNLFGVGGVSSSTMTRLNYDDQARLLVPRAVGYSAGLIDYFFRGAIEISRPTAGVFAVVDHSLPENQCTYSTTTSTCGFKTIKMKIKNVTEDIIVSGGGPTWPQHMNGGKLVAIAKFHVNTCFRPTFDQPIYGSTAAVIACRTPNQQIAVSAPYLEQGGAFFLKANEEKEVEFSFAENAIPFDATDLYIQVAYRGTLGDEEDGIAIGTYDVSEPTFITLANYTDVKIDVPGKTCIVAPTTGTVQPFDFDAKLYVLQGKLNDPGPPQYRELLSTKLDPGQYSRFVFLGDALEANMFARAYYTVARDVWFNMDNGIPNIVSQLITPTFFQRKDDGLIYYPNEEYKVREGYGHLWGVYNSRFYGRVQLSANVPVSYDDVVKVIKDCPGAMVLKPITTLAF